MMSVDGEAERWTVRLAVQDRVYPHVGRMSVLLFPFLE